MGYKVGRNFAIFVSILLGGAISAVAQYTQPTPAAAPPPVPSVPSASSQSDKNKVSPTEVKVKRWLEFDQLSTATRYHFIENDNNTKAANNDQYQFIAKLRFKFDPKGKYSIAAHFGTGTSFTSGWNNSPWGTGTLQKNFAVRQLYFDAKPTKELEFQIGGLYINYGEATEAISYDGDNFIEGERVQVRSPKQLYFDEISVTYASLRDTNQPQLFRRLKHFDDQNYHQFLVRKAFNKFVRFSADYTFQSGIDTLHEAIRFKIPPKHVIDNVLFEQYQRLDPDKDYGFNLFADRQLNKMFTVGGGFVDLNIPSLNADRFPPGKRVYFNGLAKLSREFSLSLQFTQGVGSIKPTIPRTRLDIALSYNILETLRRSKFF